MSPATLEAPTISAAMTFSQMAVNMVKRGVMVTIVAAKGKNPLPFAWQLNATMKKDVLASWIKKYGNNCNCGSVATPDTCWMFDDDRGAIAAYEKETGNKLPRTFTVSSRPGRRHLYFKQTDASRKMGNRALHNNEKSKYVAPYEFDAQQNRRQVISPGSTHPLGFIYQCIDDAEIVEAPVEFCEWIEKNGKKEKSHSTAGKYDLKTVPSFEAVNLWEHYEVEVEDDYGSNWYVTPICPYSGTAHEHSTKTAFYWDGVHFGFHCFAGGCGDPTIGDLTRKLNEDHEPFPDEIWAGYTQPDLADPRFDIEVDEVESLYTAPVDEVVLEVPTAKHSVSAKELCAILGGRIITEEEAAELIAAQKARNIVEMPAHEPVAPVVTPVGKKETMPDDDGYGIEVLDFNHESKVVLDFPRVEPKNDGIFPFPIDCMYGKLKDIALDLNVPYGFSYPALCTAACGLDIRDAADNTRASLFTALLGGYNYGKSIVTDRAAASFVVSEGVYEDGTPSSDRGFINMIGEDKSKRTVLIQDEFRTLLSKCAILNSSLTPVLCQLWSKDHAKAQDKKAVDECWGIVSMLGNLAVEDAGDFAKVMGAETTKGLYDRMLFGIGPVVDYYPCTVKKHHIDVKPCLVPAWCYIKVHEWAGEERAKRRLSEMGLRVALIQSAINGDKEVTQESFDCAMKMMDWQYSIRMVYSAGKAESKEAEAFEAVVGALQAQLDKQLKTGNYPKGAIEDAVMEELYPDWKCRQLHWSAIMNGKSLYRKYGSATLNRTKQTMAQENLISIIYDKEEDGTESRDASPFVYMRRRIK
jgi:hypothetical protein